MIITIHELDKKKQILPIADYCVKALAVASQLKFTVRVNDGFLGSHITDAESKSNLLCSRHATPASFSGSGRELSIRSIGHGLLPDKYQW